MYGRQPQLPIDVILRLTLKSISMPISTKYIQKLRESIRWDHRKANLFQQKEAWCNKCIYDKHSKAVSLRMGDMVLVCVTTFKGRHKIQSRWENSEYVVEQQPYPNLSVCVVCPIDGEGCSHTLHWNFLLLTSHNLEQEQCENVVERGGSNRPTPVPHVEDALPVDWPTESWPEGIPNSPSKQCELVDPGLTGSTSPDSADEGLSVDHNMPAPLSQSSRKHEEPIPMEVPEFCITGE